MLHPAVGDQNPEGGEIGAERHQPGDGEVADLGELVPAEEEEADEGRLEEEGHQPFDRERRAEDVADVVAVVGPVGSKLEFHGDPGGHPHGEVDAEEPAPELRHLPPDLAPGHDVDALHDAKEERKAKGQRHEQEVVHGRQAELHAR